MKNYASIQCLRAVGALLVVIFHACNVVRDRIDQTAWQFDAGALGVDLFFVISGFIMVAATHHLWGQGGQAWHFLRRRLIRIVPLYWLATSLKLALILAVPTMVQQGINNWYVISSYLFIPAWNDRHEPFPLLMPGWSLAFEMFFYLGFTAVLFLRRNPVYWLTPIFVVGVIYWIINAPFQSAPMVLLEPRLLEFCTGMWIGLATVKGHSLPKLYARLLLAAAVAMCIATIPFGLPDIPYVGIIPATLIVYAMVSLELRGTKWHNRLMHALGDASYAIYLFHPFVITVLGIAASKAGLGTNISLAIIIPLAIVGSAIAGLIIYKTVEKPMLSWLRQRFG